MRRSALLWLWVVSGCAPSIPNEERPPVVSVVYDPAVADLPTPNDLALDNGVVSIAPSTAFSPTENALHAALNGRDGFSTASTGSARFTGALSAASVTSGTALAFDLGLQGQGVPAEVGVSRVYDDCTHVLTLASSTGFLARHTYLFALRGGEAGLKDEQGGQVYESPAFHLLRAGKDLREHLDPIPGATRAEKLANATKLEAVRQGLEPFFQVLETKGVPRKDVIALWTFTVQSNGESEMDPNAQVVPFPDDLLKDPKTGLVSLPAQPTDTADETMLKAGFNQLDGFSTTAALDVDFTQPLDRSTVTAESVRVFDAAAKQPVSGVSVTLSDDGTRIVLQPGSPLLPGTPYVVVAQGLKDSAGHAVTPMPLDSVLGLAAPLLVDGKSQLSFMCAETAKQLEPLRARIGAVLDAAQIARESVSATWTFTTQDIRARAEELWNTPYEKNLPLTVLSPTSMGGPLLMPNVGQVIAGQLYTYDRIDPVTKAFMPNGAGTQRPIDFVLTLPKGATGKVKVVVFGHGLDTERRLGMMLADRLSRAGFAMMAIDLPLHGERTPCTKDGDCVLGAHCAADGACLGSNGQPADLARGPGYAGVPGPGTPLATGAAFVDLTNLFASRDHFRQALIDFSAQVRMIREFDWTTVTGGVGLDADHIDYAGISLGGILGGSESGVEPRFEAMLLNVGGAGLVDLMRESATFGPILTSGLASKGINPGTPQYDAFVNAARWVLDEVDPINLAPYARTRSWTYVDPHTGATVTPPAKALRLQEALGDTVVPNTATARLVTATGVDPSKDFATFIGTHGFLADPAEVSCYPGQEDMAGFLETH